MKNRERQFKMVPLVITLLVMVTSPVVIHNEPVPARTPILLIPENQSVFEEQGSTCQFYTGTVPIQDAAYCFVSGLIHPTTGLVRSREGECYTTVYKNALAATAFIYKGNTAGAGRIFDFFQSKLTTPFPGFRQAWNPCNGQPDNNSNYWEGDNAFILLALNYYAQKTGSYGKYSNLATTLKDWLTSRSSSCGNIVAEGVADMYAALVPFGNNWNNWQALSQLYRCFFDSKDYSSVLDHTVRGTLVFGDETGFNYVNNFKRTEVWQCNGNTVQAYSAFASENFINVEISAQLSVAAKLWQHRETGLSTLRSEIEKLLLRSQQSVTCAGLPYFVRHRANGGFPDDYSLPIVDPTAYLLYDYWYLNPFAPGRLNAGCKYDRFMPLVTAGQGQNFPRLFRVGADSLASFPQEINNGNHRQIIIAFTTSRNLLQVPVTLTVDTVGRDAGFRLNVKLDDGDHCLDVCERNGTYANSGEVGTLLLDNVCKRVFLPLIVRGTTTGTTMQSPVSITSYTYTYQLALEGIGGWGVFDWLQLEAPGEVLWTIGNKDNKCSEFDNNGFVYPCN